MDVRCIPHHANRKHVRRSSGEAEYYASASAASEAMLIREVLLFTGLEVRTELLLDIAASRGMCRREGVGTIRQLSTKVLWPQQLVKRGVVTVGACSSAENRADLGTKPLPAHRLQLLRHWNGLVLDRNERLATGDKEDGQDEKEQQEAAVQIISDRGQSDGGVLDAPGNLHEGHSWDKVRIGTSGSQGKHLPENRSRGVKRERDMA